MMYVCIRGYRYNSVGMLKVQSKRIEILYHIRGVFEKVKSVRKQIFVLSHSKRNGMIPVSVNAYKQTVRKKIMLFINSIAISLLLKLVSKAILCCLSQLSHFVVLCFLYTNNKRIGTTVLLMD